ncbi:MAG TPA: DUF5069 domain-containing protein [Opitutaceae bacterium]|nr:DUF5069 domain-containing protein [Opitutaceae bacterium]
MKHYEFQKTFKEIYDRAVALYGKGQRGADSFFSAEEKAFLAANGITPQHIYDYAEDHNNYSGEPGYDIAVAIELVRRDYFLNAQGAKPSAIRIDEAKLPAKTDAIQGIEWLPRIIPKAKAKLRGELPDSLMYCCGGDRRFLKTNDIHPAEFLTLVWRNENNDSAIADWVVKRAASSKK